MLISTECGKLLEYQNFSQRELGYYELKNHEAGFDEGSTKPIA
jgi:hypothetical protein